MACTLTYIPSIVNLNGECIREVNFLLSWGIQEVDVLEQTLS